VSGVGSDTYEHVLSQIKPYLGDKMARALIHMHCQAAGVTIHDLGADNLGRLVTGIETALRAFLGSARASTVVESMRTRSQ